MNRNEDDPRTFYPMSFGAIKIKYYYSRKLKYLFDRIALVQILFLEFLGLKFYKILNDNNVAVILRTPGNPGEILIFFKHHHHVEYHIICVC